MPELSPPTVIVNPSEIVRRRATSWRGVRAEFVQFTGNRSFEYEFRAPVHLFVARQRAIRVAGETSIDGLGLSTLHDFSRKMGFIPANHAIKGWFVPGVQPRAVYFYIDPTQLPVDPELEFSRIDFTPRLFFENQALWGTAEKLGALIDAPKSESRLYAEALSAVLAIELVRLERGALKPPTTLSGGLAARQKRMACEYIEAHLAEEVALADLAAVAKLAPAHFCRAFKRSLGIPPHRYQMQRRIEHAKALLADTERSVLQVALACGFGSSSGFTQAFRKVAGVTPSTFRRELR